MEGGVRCGGCGFSDFFLPPQEELLAFRARLGASFASGLNAAICLHRTTLADVTELVTEWLDAGCAVTPQARALTAVCQATTDATCAAMVGKLDDLARMTKHVLATAPEEDGFNAGLQPLIDVLEQMSEAGTFLDIADSEKYLTAASSRPAKKLLQP